MQNRFSKGARRLGVVGAAGASAVLLSAVPAFAHVTVDPEHAEQGGSGTVNIKVPNERDNAATTKVEVNFPKDQPLASVLPQPVPGWKAKVSKTKLDKPLTTHGEKINEAVTKITWTGGKIKPGEFQQFPVSLSQLPAHQNQLTLKALQTYDSGEVVRWIEEPQKGQPEPENPAPVLKLTPAAGHGNGGPQGGGTAQHGTDSAASGGGSGDNTDSTARVLGIVGIVVGIAGVGFGVFAGRRRSS